MKRGNKYINYVYITLISVLYMGVMRTSIGIKCKQFVFLEISGE